MLKRNVWIRLCFVVTMAGCILPARVQAQQVGRTAVEVRVAEPPTAAIALGRVHLVYEVHLTNFGAAPIAFEQLDVMDGELAVLASWSGPQLWQRVRLLGQPQTEAGTPPELRPGTRAIAYLWLSLPQGRPAPGSLRHRLTFSHRGAARDTVVTASLSVRSTAPSMAAPVRGGPWLAVRGPSNGSGHRLSLVTLDGEARVPQRFAVDWALLGDDGRLFRGDSTDVTNWYGYDAPVYAAAAGTVVLTRDGASDRKPFGVPPPAVIEAADAPGNVVVIDIGQGRFATYAHLKPGSLRVAEGERVVEGQPLARIGNSGNTLGPHLHFHISDAVEPLGGEGLPFSLGSFSLIGRVASLPALLAGTPWTANPSQPARTVVGETPLENMVIQFSSDAGASRAP